MLGELPRHQRPWRRCGRNRGEDDGRAGGGAAMTTEAVAVWLSKGGLVGMIWEHMLVFCCSGGRAVLDTC